VAAADADPDAAAGAVRPGDEGKGLTVDDSRLTPNQLRTLLAVCRLYARGPVTVRGVARLLGHAEPGACVHRWLKELRGLGLVRWDAGRCGTIAPACTVTVGAG
jgi:hypothetical protein